MMQQGDAQMAWFFTFSHQFRKEDQQRAIENYDRQRTDGMDGFEKSKKCGNSH